VVAGSRTSARAHWERWLRDSVVPRIARVLRAGLAREADERLSNFVSPACGSNRRELPSPY
jgi:hypothetical protein